MALRGESYLAAAVGAIGGDRFRRRVASQAARYWLTPKDALWESNSHWRDAMGDAAWLEVGEDHWAIFEAFTSALRPNSGPGTVIEWGCGGGANAVAFAPRAEKFIGADISEESLAECERQVHAVCATPVDMRCIDLAKPEDAAQGLEQQCSTFLCLYVIEVTTGPEEVKRILRIAEQVLVSGGIAFVQMKYHTSDRHTRGRPGLRYSRNLSLTTTFTIEEFWELTRTCGLQPKLITLVPQNRLDVRYAYFALVKP